MTFEWPTEEKPLSELTLKEVEDIAKTYREKREEIDQQKQVLSALEEERKALERKLVSILEGNQKSSYDSAVGRISLGYRTSIRVPQGDDRAEFFNYLREKGVFEEMITVNSQTLNAFYKQEEQLAREEGRGMEFHIPGIKAEAISMHPVISLRKK